MAIVDESKAGCLGIIIGIVVGFFIGAFVGIIIEERHGSWSRVPYPECGESVIVHGPCDMTFEESINE